MSKKKERNQQDKEEGKSNNLAGKKIQIKVYMEGGVPRGQQKNRKSSHSNSEIFNGVKIFLEKTVKNQNVSIEVTLCGGGQKTVELFLEDIENKREPEKIKVLLVDSEGLVNDPNQRRAYLKKQGMHGQNYAQQLDKIDEKYCHLMVQEMEAWFIADEDALKEVFGNNFVQNKIPKTNDVEIYTKDDVAQFMHDATTGKYIANGQNFNKSETKLKYSGRILAHLDPQKVYAKSVHFQKLQQALEDFSK